MRYRAKHNLLTCTFAGRLPERGARIQRQSTNRRANAPLSTPTISVSSAAAAARVVGADRYVTLQGCLVALDWAHSAVYRWLMS